jgi:hypothetical protein
LAGSVPDVKPISLVADDYILHEILHAVRRQLLLITKQPIDRHADRE